MGIESMSCSAAGLHVFTAVHPVDWQMQAFCNLIYNIYVGIFFDAMVCKILRPAHHKEPLSTVIFLALASLGAGHTLDRS